MGWAGEPLTGEAVEVLKGLKESLEEGAALALRLGELLTPAEVQATRRGWRRCWSREDIRNPAGSGPHSLAAGVRSVRWVRTAGTRVGDAQERLPGHPARSGS